VRCIAAFYVQLFFPEITPKEYANKVAEIERILANAGSGQTDHRTFIDNIYGNEDFFNQTADPLRQLIIFAIEKGFKQDTLDLESHTAVQDFYIKIVMFIAAARGIIATVADSLCSEFFGEINLLPLAEGGESFDAKFSKSQIYFTKWLASEYSEISPNKYLQKEALDTFSDVELRLPNIFKRAYRSTLGCSMLENGFIIRTSLNMFFIGSVLFKECIEKANRLKETPNNPKARTAFTQAMKKFIYTWSQSSTCYRGQAAMLMMLVDSIAKYAGFKLKRPKTPQKVRAALAQLSERFPDTDPRTNETDIGYTVPIIGFDVERRKDEKWLQDFYYHYDVFAMHMPSFEVFDKRYPCEFVPLQENETPAESN
jgi:hypothetical protein